MWRDMRPKRRRLFFTMISLSIGLLIIAAGLFVWYSLQPPVPPQATCGTVTFLQGRDQSPVSKGAQQVESCFFRAYQHCSAMSMAVTDMGTDAGATTTYWPQQHENTCQILAQSFYYNVGIGHSSPETITCQTVLLQKGGLLFQRCSTSGDVFIAG